MTRRQALKFSSAPQALWSGGRSSLIAPAFHLALPGYDLLFGSLHLEVIIFRLRVPELRVLALTNPLIRYCLAPGCSPLLAHLRFTKTLYPRISSIFHEGGTRILTCHPWLKKHRSPCPLIDYPSPSTHKLPLDLTLSLNKATFLFTLLLSNVP